MRRAALAAAVLLAAVLLQLTLLNSLPWPGGAPPDLVLIVVVALGLTGGPAEGMLGGFLAGLALDVAPPASHLIGQYALVLCVAGYVTGRLRGDLDRAAWLPLGAVALCSAGGELLYAVTGMMFGDPDITWPAVRNVLPVSVAYDLLLSPFVLYAVLRLRGWAVEGLRARGGVMAGSALAGSGLAPGPGPLAAPGGAGLAVRDTKSGRTPRLRAARHADGWIGGVSQLAGRAAAQLPAGRPLHLRLRGGQGGSATGTQVTKGWLARPVHLRLRGGRGGSATGTQVSKGWLARPVNLRLGSRRRGGGVGGGSLRGAAGSAFGRLGDGGGGRALRPARGPRLRGRVMPGGSASGIGVRTRRPARPVHLRLGSARRRDGTAGGSPGGRGRPGRISFGGGGVKAGAVGGAAFRGGGPGGTALNRGALRGGGPGGSAFRGGGSVRSGPGKAAAPRFRGIGRGRPAGRRKLLPGVGGGLAGGRLGRGQRRARFGGRRSAVWRIGTKRTGGLP